MAEECGMFKGLKLGKLSLQHNEQKWIVAQDWVREKGLGPRHTETCRPRTRAQVFSECEEGH